MQVDLDELERLEREASPSDWTWDGPKHNVIIWLDNGAEDRVCFMASDGCPAENAAFIAGFRNAAPSLISELREARKTIAGTCHQVVSLSADKRKLEAEIGDLRDEVKTFLVLWAARYSEMQGLGGAFHPQHFDRLKELGARMDDFKRADLPPAKETP